VEIHPGVFVSSTATEDWRPDPEVGGELHVLVEDETAYAGMSRFGDVANPEPWTLPERETLLILEGAARIEIEDGSDDHAAGWRPSFAPQGRRDHLASDASFQGAMVLWPTLRDGAAVARRTSG
jgi:hypothetical protein